jgi:hypothetical protein
MTAATMSPQEVLAAIEARAGASDANPGPWHMGRAFGITATQVRDLYLRRRGISAGDSQSKLIADKVAMIRAAEAGDMAEVERLAAAQGGRSKHAQWGHTREPGIMRFLAEEFPGMQPESRTFHHPANRRHLASPDGILVDRAGRVIIAEVKTSTLDIDLHGENCAHKGYPIQMAWIMYVIGARTAVYAWEQHDNDWHQVEWSRWPEPSPLNPFPTVQLMQYDEALVTELIDIADTFLAALDAALAGEVAPLDDFVDGQAVKALIALRDEQEAAGRKTAARESIERHLEATGLDEFQQKSALAQVSWKRGRTVSSPSQVPMVEVDEARAKSDHRELFEQMQLARAELADAVALADALEQKWEAVLEDEQYRATSMVPSTKTETVRKNLTIREARVEDESAAETPRKGRKS